MLAGGALASDIGLVTLAADLQSDNARPIRTRLMPLVKEGFATSLTEAATRFAISHPAMGTILVGMATPQQFEAALAAVQKGPAMSLAGPWGIISHEDASPLLTLQLGRS